MVQTRKKKLDFFGVGAETVTVAEAGAFYAIMPDDCELVWTLRYLILECWRFLCVCQAELEPEEYWLCRTLQDIKEGDKQLDVLEAFVQLEVGIGFIGIEQNMEVPLSTFICHVRVNSEFLDKISNDYYFQGWANVSHDANRDLGTNQWWRRMHWHTTQCTIFSYRSIFGSTTDRCNCGYSSRFIDKNMLCIMPFISFTEQQVECVAPAPFRVGITTDRSAANQKYVDIQFLSHYPDGNHSYIIGKSGGATTIPSEMILCEVTGRCYWLI